jgi:hypothetical protein
MVVFSNIMAREMIEHLFLTYGSVTAVDLEHNFEQICKAWDPQQPVETLFKQNQDCADFSEAGCMEIGHAQQINVEYAKIFTTVKTMGACHRWNENKTWEKIWANFKVYFSVTHRQHNQMQGESAANSGYHAANTTVGETEDQMSEATIGDLANLATATSTDHCVMVALTEANLRLVRHLEDRFNELNEIKAILKKERADRKGQIKFNPIYGCMDTRWQIVTHTRLVIIKRTDTNARPLRRATWEEVKPTGNDV